MTEPRARAKLLLRVVLRFGLGMVFLGGLFFLTAGTWRFWPAWIFCSVLFVPMMGVVAYLFRRDPALLERRITYGESQPTQKKVIAAYNLVYIAGYSLPGLDHRFAWSEVPLAVVLVANAVVFFAYLWVAWVLVTNSYASRTVRVEAEQTLIDTGPYAQVRHPMYTGVAVMTLASPLALGSYWALLPVLFAPPLLAWRIRDEERLLREELPGYVEYCERVPWRLVPGLW